MSFMDRKEHITVPSAAPYSYGWKLTSKQMNLMNEFQLLQWKELQYNM